MNFIVWDVNPEIFHIGDFSIRWYGLLFALGFLIGQRIMAHIFKAEGVKEELVDAITLYMVIATVVGARVGHYLFYETPLLMQSPGLWLKEMILPPYRGLASHGASIGMFTGLWLFARRYNMKFFYIADRVAITVALGGCFIRFGNLMNSEIVGTPTEVPWAFLFIQNNEFSQVPRHAAQLYESLSCLVLFFIMFAIWRRFKLQLPQGTLTGLLLIWVFTLRFFYEFLKEDQVAFEQSMGLNMGQVLSIPAVLFGIIGVWYALNKRQTVIWRSNRPTNAVRSLK
ncbi:MAG: prolipoprotein diacylglyceryl transferase [Cytophagaceae bacterium]|nr:prolipoprotein diacylglyceryl transferase [Cytophagaceae bacterium]